MMIHSPLTELSDHVQELLTVAFTDEDADTPRNAIKALSLRPVESFLVTPLSFEAFQVIVNDHSFEIRCAVVELWPHLKDLNPFRPLPIFRPVILDDVFLLQSLRCQHLQTEMTGLLHLLIRRAEEILPIYASSICELCSLLQGGETCNSFCSESIAISRLAFRFQNTIPPANHSESSK
jgi:hypothetical protein